MEADAYAVNRESSARDERVLCGTEQAWSSGQGGGEIRSAWRAERHALVTAGTMASFHETEELFGGRML